MKMKSKTDLKKRMSNVINELEDILLIIQREGLRDT